MAGEKIVYKWYGGTLKGWRRPREEASSTGSGSKKRKRKLGRHSSASLCHIPHIRAGDFCVATKRLRSIWKPSETGKLGNG